MKKRIKINGLIILGAVLLLVFFPRLFFRNDSAGLGTEALEVFGLAAIILGQTIRVSARGYKAENSENSHALIQGGPYQVVRNPMYLGIFLVGLGVVLALFKWWVITIFFIFFIVRYILLIHREEKKLNAMFGESYRAYCRKVPRLLPKLASLLTLDVCAYLPIKLSWFKKEIGSITTLLFLVLLAESWEEIQKWGVKVYLKESVGLLLVVILFFLLVIWLDRRTQEKHEDRANKSKNNP